MTAAPALDPRQVRFRYLVVQALRWLPTGLLIPVTTLLMLDRGLSLAEVGTVVATQGLVVLFLELPTGGLADSLGRRPVLIAASGLAVVSTVLLAGAASYPAFLAVWLVQGASRALDSGPLDAWFVDATLAADPRARLEPGLGAGGGGFGGFWRLFLLFRLCRLLYGRVAGRAVLRPVGDVGAAVSAIAHLSITYPFSVTIHYITPRAAFQERAQRAFLKPVGLQ